MPVIKRLPELLKNKIAAGEVVERPASVVRELVENAIDASATEISVEIKSAGRAMVRVSDNGSGMDAEDARLSIERHTTSKLKDEAGLFSISTMGFRGEALPSIASVSRMTLRTARDGQPEGVELEIEAGAIRHERPAASKGTMMEVRDLFYNTPARRKFLKRDTTETLHIVDAVTSLALSHPHIAFSLIAEGQETMRLGRAASLKERLTQVYGEEFMAALVPIERITGELSLEAYASALGRLRESRGNQHLFINGRPVRDTSISHAIYSAYEGYEPKGRHPVYFLSLRVPPTEIDFNVHPAKREVRFADKESIYRFVRKAFRECILPAPEAGPIESVAGNEPGVLERAALNAVTYPSSSVQQDTGGMLKAAEAVMPLLPMGAYGTRSIYLGESFVAFSEGEGFTLMDHHAAHERVLYERLLKGMRMESKLLLFPRQIKLSPKEKLTLLEQKPMLHEMGIEIDDFGPDVIVVRALPARLDQADMRGILQDAAAAIAEGDKPGAGLREAVAARVACHASVRGSKVLSEAALDALVKDLRMCDDPRHCPHGRPTTITYRMDDLRRLFKRI